MNPRAIVFFGFCTGIGYLATGTFYGAAVGATSALGLSFFSGLLSDR